MRAMHPDAANLMALIKAAGRPAFESLTPAEARAAYAAGRPFLQNAPEPVAEVEDFDISGPGGLLKLRRYRGIGTQADAALPCLLYLHGGGWVIGDLESHDGICRRLANESAGCVVAVDYRLAPEHPFPAAIDDAQAALSWVAGQADTLRIDGARIAVGGDSAGGTLAATLALAGRDGTGPAPVFQLLFYPVLDLTMACDSYSRITDGVPLTAATMRYFIDLYTPDETQRLSWRASPLHAASLAGAAPCFIVTAGHDPLCDEGRAYAARLESEGVRVTALHLSDHVHGLLTMTKVIGPSDPLLAYAGAALRDAWRPR